MRIIVISITFILFSCGQKQFDGEIKTLDSLQKKVVEVQNNLSSLDSVTINEISKEIPQTLADLNKVYKPDSINIPISTLINVYNSFRNYKATFNMQRLRITKEIPYTIKQLEHLCTDLKNNSLKTEDANKYVLIEKKAAREVIETFTNLKSQSVSKIAKYDSTLRLMDQLIDSLRTDSLNIQAIRLKMLKGRTKRR